MCRCGPRTPTAPAPGPGTSAGTTSDHGDTVSAATAITVGSEVPGRIHAAGDTDHFTFTLDGATYVLLEASTGAGTLSLTPTLYDDHGAEVYLYYLNESGWSVIDDGGLSMYALERLKAGTYTIRIAAAAAGQSGSYLLKSPDRGGPGHRRGDVRGLLEGAERPVDGAERPAVRVPVAPQEHTAVRHRWGGLRHQRRAGLGHDEV